MRFPHVLRLLLAFLFGPAAVSSASAAPFTWTGNSTASNAWSDSANWLGGAIPTNDSASAVSFTSAGAQAAASPNSLQNLTPTPYALNNLLFGFAGSGTFILSGNDISLAGSGALTQSSAYNVTVNNNLSPGSGSTTFLVSGDGAGTLTLNGAIGASNAALTKNGASGLTLGGTGTFSSAGFNGGITTQSGGTQTITNLLTVNNTNASTTVSYNMMGGSLNAQGVLVGTTTLGGAASAGASAFNQSGGRVDARGPLSVVGKGVYSLSGNGVFSMPNGFLNFLSGGMLNQSGGTLVVNTLNMDVGTCNVSGGTLNASVGYVGDYIAGGTSGGACALNITNAGVVQVGGGALNVGSAGRITVSGGGMLSANDLGSATGTAAIALSDPSSAVSALTITSGASNSTFAGVISDASGGPGGLTKSGVGNSTFSGVNTYTGPTRINGGTLTLTSTGSIANSSVISVASAATLNVNAKAAPGLAVSSGQTLNDNGSVTGSLDVRGMLTGTGMVSGSVLAESASTIAPGNNGPGILSTGGVTFSSGSNFALELRTTAPGTGYDRLDVTGTVTLNNATLSLSQTLPVGTAAGTNFFILTNDGADAINGTFSGLAQNGTVTINGTAFRISYTGDSAGNIFAGAGNDVALQNINAVPEPTSLALLGVTGVCGLLLRRRRS